MKRENKVIIENNEMRYRFLVAKAGISIIDLASSGTTKRDGIKIKRNNEFANKLKCKYIIEATEIDGDAIITNEHLSLFDFVKVIIKYRKSNITEVAKKHGTSKQNISQVLKRESISIEDLKKILNVLDFEVEDYFIFEDGTIL